MGSFFLPHFDPFLPTCMCRGVVVELNHTQWHAHSVGLLWTRDRAVAETSTWQHTTLTRDRHDLSDIRTRDPRKRKAADPCLRQRGHWDVLTLLLSIGRLQLKCDGTRWRTEGEVKGKLANGVGSQYSSHYLGTWCIQHYYGWCAHLGCASSRLNWRPPPI